MSSPTARCGLHGWPLMGNRCTGCDRERLRTIRLEALAVEEGHHAIVQTDGSIRVASDSYRDKWYEVRFQSTTGGITFTCQPRGRQAYKDDHLHLTGRSGLIQCKHMAMAARRLEREGIARLDGGRWYAKSPTPVASRVPDDPFDGLPH